ncbi:hypothetical protein CCR97_18265 [Rhodoplanes elegans]|uniref:Uncharacterized protein n=1 Tax=Rhodoplanes elegans TaxID=29408 RepID=A0A327KVX6_9BRAD|nr:hypothetical protein [Rhodoplanes elegans]MBK5960134.1 hypothetical protein [Rhodoplanes elegans]RAI41362.1 hypothetical protein CH338_03420 [Rhodoplanes elegans]
MPTVMFSASALTFGVMPGLVPGIHDAGGCRLLVRAPRTRTWMAGTSPAMTDAGIERPPESMKVEAP